MSAPDLRHSHGQLRSRDRTRSLRPSPPTWLDTKNALKAFGFAPGIRADYALARVGNVDLGGAASTDVTTAVRCALIGLIPTQPAASLSTPRELNYYTEIVRWKTTSVIEAGSWNQCNWQLERGALASADHGYADLWGFAPYFARSPIGPVPEGGNLLLAATRILALCGAKGGVRVDYFMSALRGLLSWSHPPTLWSIQDHRIACGLHTILRDQWSPTDYMSPDALARLATYVTGHYDDLVTLLPLGRGCQFEAPSTDPSLGSRFARGAAGAMTGAGTGAAFGGWGAVAGAAIGFVVGVLS